MAGSVKRLYSLDALRGVAALVVVIWHWQHFYAISGRWPRVWHRESEPFFALLRPFYLEGWAAVDMFFALSGFVFFWLYAARVSAGEVRASAFAWKRFSRLYPLHLAALVLVVVLQILFRARTGTDFIFPSADWGRLAACLIMAQQWLPPTIAQCFNGPAWTVSIEAGLYVLFFLLCRLGFAGPKSACVVSLAGIALFSWNEFIGRGVTGFFLGGVCYYAVAAIQARTDARRIAWASIWLALVLWVVALGEIVCGLLHQSAEVLTDFIAADDFYAVQKGHIFQFLYVYTVVPASIIALALHESVLGSGILGGVYRRLSYLGDISYSTYMLHFPLQIACALLALQFGFGPAVFDNGLLLVAFYGVLLALGAASWRWFEIPAQQALRLPRVKSA